MYTYMYNSALQVIVGIVITKQSIHSFPDKKSKLAFVSIISCRLVSVTSPDPGVHRFKFAFTIRDSPSDYVNVNCWGSEAYIRSLVDSFKICDVGETTTYNPPTRVSIENGADISVGTRKGA